MELELISFKMCPFMQRILIVLLHRDLPYKVTYIDPGAPPDWFMALSPLGKTPILKVDGETVLFESAVIAEFIDELAPGSMLPDTPLARAVSRGWGEFGASLLPDNLALISARSKDDFEQARETLVAKLERLDSVIHGPFFNGDQLSLVDAVFAPLFMRLAINGELTEIFSRQRLLHVAAWSDSLLELPAVGNSVVAEFRELYLGIIQNQAGYLAGLVE